MRLRVDAYKKASKKKKKKESQNPSGAMYGGGTQSVSN